MMGNLAMAQGRPISICGLSKKDDYDKRKHRIGLRLVARVQEVEGQPWEHPDIKDCGIFEAYNKDIEDETIMFVVVKDGYARHITTQEEYDVIWDITFPPCL